jgi:ribosome-associated toxin RatA of RatAB toxin-antitoxin module
MRAASVPERRERRRSRRRFSAVVLLQLACIGRLAAAEPDLAWIDRQALADGMVLLNAERGERSDDVVHVKVAAEVTAAPTAIWEVLRACQIAPEYVPNVVSCRSLEVLDDGHAELFVQTVKPAFFVPSFEHVFRLDYTPYTRIDMHRVSGPVAHLEGTWWLLPQANGRILLLYELALDPGFLVPRFFVRATLKRDLPKVIAAVRARAEASP